MFYVMSDIHGCYDKYIRMINKIELGEEDILYILGDIVDRGPSGLKIALDIAKRKNFILLRGNHDQQAALLLSNLYLLREDDMAKKLAPIFGEWLSGCENLIIKEYLELNERERKIVIKVISNSLISKEVEVNGNKYLLAHTVPEIKKLNEYKEWNLDDYIMGEPDYDKMYFKDRIIITGHTPTFLIEQGSIGRIWKKNNHIAIDCGAVFGNPLGCLRLDDMKEFYVE